MKPDAIHLSDWNRILFGDAPPQFLVEVFFRSIVMYLALLVTLRFLGKRMNAQLSITELAVMISIGAIVSLPMQSPGRGLLNGILLLFLILVFQRGLGLLSFRSSRMERIVYGTMSILVKDGILQTESLRKAGITKDQLFAQLRRKEVRQLGELDRVYFEANGVFSIFPSRSPRPGLSTYPEKDDASLAAQDSGTVSVCSNCGTIGNEAESDRCPNCHHHRWTPAVT